MDTCAYDLDYVCDAPATHDLVCSNAPFDPVPSCVVHLSHMVDFNINESPTPGARISAIAR